MIETASHLGDKLANTVEQVGALGRTAGKKFAEARGETASALNASACSIRDAGEAVGEMADNAAAKLDHSAEFVRDYEISGVLTSLRKMIRHNPAGFVAGALAAGFLVGRAARKA
ncbi:MAG: hypothetical protein IPP47_32970 [Bryobacterales bacterium]|nr:hypothetical protein [Bryobacterales bacterium]